MKLKWLKFTKWAVMISRISRFMNLSLIAFPKIVFTLTDSVMVTNCYL